MEPDGPEYLTIELPLCQWTSLLTILHVTAHREHYHRHPETAHKIRDLGTQITAQLAQHATTQRTPADR